MATRKTTSTATKTTARKTAAKAETVKNTEPVVETVAENNEEVKEEIKEVPKKEKRVFKDSDGIPCRSITQGGLFMEGAKTHMLYEWVEYGDITQVEYADLASAVRVKSTYIFGPYFMIDDDDFVEEFPALKKFYTENYTVEDLETILSYPVERMIDEVKALPKSAQESLKVLAASSINDGDLDSVSKIKALDDIFGTKLSILAEFKD